MPDEKLQRNASNFCIFLEYRNPCTFFHFSFWLYFFPGKNKILGSSKWNKKKLHWFLSFKNMVNFVAFLWISSFFKTRLFLKSEYNTFVWQKKISPKSKIKIIFTYLFLTPLKKIWSYFISLRYNCGLISNLFQELHAAA